MIEPEYAARLGVSQTFEQGDQHAVELACTRLQVLGVRHIRLPFAAGMLSTSADRAWFAWLVARLASVAELLPSLDLDGLQDVTATLERLLSAPDTVLDAVELCGTDESLRLACAATRKLGLSAIPGIDAAAASERLAALGGAGVLRDVAAIGLRFAQNDTAAAHATCEDAARILGGYNPDAAVWVTEYTATAPRHQHASHAHAFLDCLALPAERTYWPALTNATATNASIGTCGLQEPSGQPTLLGRLLEGGVAGVDKIVALTRAKAAATHGARPVLITGGAGFIGANLADRLAADGNRVLIYDALARPGVERNLRWLARRHPSRISFVLGDLRDEQALSDAAAEADAVFHLAGQVAVTTSMVSPLDDFEVNARGTLALLDALRTRNPRASLVFASTNKVYGDLADIELVREGDSYLPSAPDLRAHGVDEHRPLCFHTPYGCSKGAADQYVLDYAHSFGLRTAVLRMSCIYGQRQLGTEDQGWVAHFLLRAIAGEPITIYGDGRQVRDVLDVGDAVSAYVAAWRNIDRIAGRAYNLGGGPANAISLLQLISHIEDLLGRRVDVSFDGWRPGDQRYFVADTRAVQRDLSLPPALGWRIGLARLANHFGAMPAQAEAAQ